jgi:predicted ArsR family transcriptional regulator
MSRMSELLPTNPAYPDAPGYKSFGPSEIAAASIASTASKLRAIVLAEFQRTSSGLTADEIAKSLNLSVLSVRPRVSELRRNGQIEQTGARRKNASGMTATVWRISSVGPR